MSTPNLVREGFYNLTRTFQIQHRNGSAHNVDGYLRRPTTAELQAGYSLENRVFFCLNRDLNLHPRHPEAYDELVDTTEGRTYRIESKGAVAYHGTLPQYVRFEVSGGQ